MIMTDYASQSSKLLTDVGTKARQRSDGEDRSLVYRDFRREVGKIRDETDGRKRKTAYTNDLDQIEYIFVNDEPVPIAILEITRYDFDEYDLSNAAWMRYRAAILDRYFVRDAQGRFIQAIAKKLECEAYIVLFRNDLKSFWIFNLMQRDANWVRKEVEEYKAWLAELRTRALDRLLASQTAKDIEPDCVI